MNCAPTELARIARCFCWLPRTEYNGALIYALCQWANQPHEPPGPVCTLSSFLTYPSTAGRNDLNITCGIRFQVKEAITVCRIGRLYVAGNTQNHLARIWISTDTVTPIASGTILAASASDANNFKWVDITPITLNVGSTYAVGLDENVGGDVWKDQWSVLASLNYTYFQSVVEGFKVGYGYPSTGTNANLMYSTPALWFTAA